MVNRFSSLLFIGLSIVLLVIGLTSKPVQLGDGHEYSLTTKAFLNNLSPKITAIEVTDRLNDIRSFESAGYIPEYFEKIRTGLENNENNAGAVGIYKSKNNEYYGYHFWFYPLLTAVTEKTISILDVNPLKSFQLTNVILLICTLFVLMSNEKSNPVAQLLFLSGGVIFYLKWSHPEVMIYSLLFLAFYFLMKCKPLTSAFFISLASIQVVSLSLLFIVIPIYLTLVSHKNIVSVIFDLLRKWQIWICGLISISSIIFYYIKFNQFSLIGSQASSISNINFGHFISYYFDLDQGLWVGAPWLVIFVVFLCFRFDKIIIRDFLFSLLFSVVICMPLLANNNMNSGQNVFQRYALYSVAPIVAWSCAYSSVILNTIYKKVIIILLAFMYIIFSNGYETDANYLAHKPWTAYLLENYPEMYNPEPQIFILRTFSYNMWSGKGQDSYAYENQDGIVTKIIFRDKNEHALSDSCKAGYKDLMTHQPINIDKASAPKYGWRYITGAMYCDDFAPVYKGVKYIQKASNFIDFRKNGLPNFVIGLSGLSHEEGWGRWSEGSNVKLNLDLKLNKETTFYAELFPFGPNAGEPIVLTINNESHVMEPVEGKGNVFYAKFESIDEKQNTAITVNVSKPTSPAELGVSSDKRKIGLGLIQLYWQ